MRASYEFFVIACLALFADSARAESIAGDWVTQGYSARVRIAGCTENPGKLCDTITWLWDAIDERGRPMVDRNNPDQTLRSQPLVGLSILKNFRATSNFEWSDGSIYDPEGGRTYKSKLKLRTADILEVSGCVLFVCKTQIWRRPSTMCPVASVATERNRNSAVYGLSVCKMCLPSMNTLVSISKID